EQFMVFICRKFAFRIGNGIHRSENGADDRKNRTQKTKHDLKHFSEHAFSMFLRFRGKQTAKTSRKRNAGNNQRQSNPRVHGSSEKTNGIAEQFQKDVRKRQQK